jgi:excisionase family DNA binding protein
VEEAPVMFTVAEIAEKLKVSSRLVYKLVETGELLSYRIGTAIRIKQEDLDTYLNGRRNTTPPTDPRSLRRLSI